jgi:hypothetical protein
MHEVELYVTFKTLHYEGISDARDRIAEAVTNIVGTQNLTELVQVRTWPDD